MLCVVILVLISTFMEVSLLARKYSTCFCSTYCFKANNDISILRIVKRFEPRFALRLNKTSSIGRSASKWF